MKLKKVKRSNNLNLILFIGIVIIIAVIYVLKIFSERALPIFINYSEMEAKRISTLLINNSLMNEALTNITFDDLFITKEQNGKVISIDVNSAKANQLLLTANNVLEQNFKYLEDGEIDKLKVKGLNIESDKKGVIYEMPSGIIFNNIFLNNLFPKIPVKLNLAGTIFSKLTTDVESYGINNAIFKVNIYVSSEVKVVLPFASKNIKIESTIPIIIKIIEGDVPSYYFGNDLIN